MNPSPSTSLRKPREPKRVQLSCIYGIISHLVVAFMSFHLGFLFGSGGGARWETVAASAPAAAPVKTSGKNKYFPTAAIGKLIEGAALVDRKDFTKEFDIGVPWDIPKGDGNDYALMLYSHNSSLPNLEAQASSSMPVFASAKEATKNCNVMKVVLLQGQVPNQCLAIVGQWESYHVHKYMRTPDVVKKVAASSEFDLRYVARSHTTSGLVSRLPRAAELTEGKYGKILTEYIQKLPETLERLKPIAENAAGKDNIVVVMVCNFGQAELLFNFVCSARARNLDLSKVLVFATDEETIDLAKNLGLHVFDVQDSFGDMPKKAAKKYGDAIFAGMMMAKVYCVHVVNMLGYHLLFQDVDVVWYKNPIDEFFKNTQVSGNFDIYFQDDGARTARYAPYSPNTGFYFVRHNARTEYFFSMFARMGDSILQSGSHQTVLTSLINEHASWKGLRIKVFGRDDELGLKFPGGFHFHQRREYMKEFALGKHHPLIFHMSWTKNKDNKRMFLEQMADWFVKDECVDKEVAKIDNWSPLEENSLAERCCFVEPDFKCHYRDKPSKKPCKDSPPIDQGKKSFW